jgi:hypothetical protein
MEIIIHDKDAYQHSLEQYNILWQLSVRRNRRSYFIQYGVGILFLLFGLIPVGDWDFKTDNANHITHQTETRTDKDSMNIALIVGVVWILLVSASLIRLGKTKQAFMDEAGYRGRIVYKASNESMTSINEERVRYENPVTKSEWKWMAFLTYSLYKEYIILNYDRTGRSSFVIEEKLLPPDSYKLLLDLIRQKVQELKI